MMFCVLLRKPIQRLTSPCLVSYQHVLSQNRLLTLCPIPPYVSSDGLEAGLPPGRVIKGYPCTATATENCVAAPVAVVAGLIPL